jgi:hypothetical protein
MARDCAQLGLTGLLLIGPCRSLPVWHVRTARKANEKQQQVHDTGVLARWFN